MEETIRKSGFKLAHPWCIFIYFFTCIGVTAFTKSLVIVGVSFAVVTAYTGFLWGHKGIIQIVKMACIVVILSSVINMLVSHSGATVLFYLNDNPITLESLCFGMFYGVILVSIISWFRIFNYMVTGEGIMFVFGKISSVLALMISMIIRYVPLLKRRYSEISAGQRYIGHKNQKGIFRKVENTIKKVSVLIGWSLEAAIESGNSMESRGYGLKGRTSFHLYKMKTSDFVIISALAILNILFVGLWINKGENTLFFPEVTIENFKGYNLIVGSVFLVSGIIPICTDIFEEIKWAKLESKI